MSREKQIEEMADDVRRIRESYFGQADYLFAMKLYEDGYRKQSEPYSRGHEKGGEWIAHRDPFDICATDFVCSACKESFCSSELTDEEFFEMMKYCPNCGAKMKGGE